MTFWIGLFALVVAAVLGGIIAWRTGFWYACLYVAAGIWEMIIKPVLTSYNFWTAVMFGLFSLGCYLVLIGA